MTSNHQVALILELLIPSLLGSTVFFGGAYLWRLPELSQVLELIDHKRAKWRQK